jgi:hypothetical protein
MVSLILGLIFLFQSANHPHFEDYPVMEKFKGIPSKVNLKSDSDARMFRTVLREGASQGPNFADHYTIVIWGQGTNAQQFAIVDAISGSVYIFPESISNGLMFKRNSNLLIVAPITKTDMEDYHNDLPDWLVTRYYKWNGKIFILIDTSRSITNISDEVK